MRNLFLLLVFLSLNEAWAVVPSGVPMKTLGGYTNSVASMPHDGGNLTVPVSDISQFTLYAGTLSIAASNSYYPFYRDGVLYQVPSGYTCRCDNVTYKVSSANGGWQLMSATVAYAKGDTSITGGVWMSGVTSIMPMAGSPTANATITEGIQYTFASQTYPGAQFQDNTQAYQVRMSCRETAN